jgi:hypothetical protein
MTSAACQEPLSGHVAADRLLSPALRSSLYTIRFTVAVNGRPGGGPTGRFCRPRGLNQGCRNIMIHAKDALQGFWPQLAKEIKPNCPCFSYSLFLFRYCWGRPHADLYDEGAVRATSTPCRIWPLRRCNILAELFECYARGSCEDADGDVNRSGPNYTERQQTPKPASLYKPARRPTLKPSSSRISAAQLINHL